MKQKSLATSTVVLIVGMAVAILMFIPVFFDFQNGGLDEQKLILQDGTELSCVVNNGYREGGLDCFVTEKLDK